MIDELEKQLHEQYAVNNNSNVGSFVAMIGALMVAFTGYGYVYNLIEYPNGRFDLFDLATIAIVIVITILYIVAIELGTGQRLEQFITYAIRRRAYESQSLRYNAIYPQDYKPFNKNFCNFVQGVYNILSNILFLCCIAILVVSNHHSGCALHCSVWCVSAFAIGYMIYCKIRNFYKYRKREKEFAEKNLFTNEQQNKSTCDIIVLFVFPAISIAIALVAMCANCYADIFWVCNIVCSVYTILTIYRWWHYRK